jgi:hypothetical protein
MEATRRRFGSVLEWMLAAGVIIAVVAVGSIVVREFRTVRPVMPVMASEAPAEESAAGLPARAVSVPLLILDEGKTLRVADRESEVERLVGRDARVGQDTVERRNGADRIIRAYDYLGTRFVVVFDASADGDEPEVAAIYLE